MYRTNGKFVIMTVLSSQSGLVFSIFLGYSMKNKNKILAVGLLGALASFASADFTVSASGPIGSNAGLGDLSNVHLGASYTGASSIYGNFAYSGTLTSVIPATFANEAGWSISNTNQFNNFGFFALSGGTFSQPLNASISSNGLFWLNNGDAYDFESFEDFDDGGGADSSWTDVNFTWSGAPTINDLGTFASGSLFDFDTLDSDELYDTVMGLFSENGTLLDFNDDAVPGTILQSEINAGALADGTYYLAVGGFGFEVFDNGIAIGGESEGHLDLHLNGSSIFNGVGTAGNLNTFKFTVGSSVPEPASMAVLGLGALALLRRRNKR